MKVVGGWTNVIMHKITSSDANWQVASIQAVNDQAYYHSIRGDHIFVKFFFYLDGTTHPNNCDSDCIICNNSGAKCYYCLTSGASADGLCTDAIATTRDSVGGADMCVTDPVDPDPEETDPEETDPEETDPEESDPEESDDEGLSLTLLIIIAGSGTVGLILLYLFCKFGRHSCMKKNADNKVKQ
jgi:hypothetical protein